MTGKASINNMPHAVGDFLKEHNEVANVVRNAQNFSVQLPLVGKLRVPQPKELAFYGVIGGLAAFGVIEWPAAAGLALGIAVINRTMGPDAQPESGASSKDAAAGGGGASDQRGSGGTDGDGSASAAQTADADRSGGFDGAAEADGGTAAQAADVKAPIVESELDVAKPRLRETAVTVAPEESPGS